MSLRGRLAEALFGDVIEERVKAAVKVVDDTWWRQVDGAAGPQDKKWWDLRSDIEDALEAWRTNPLAFRIVALTTDYVVGNGIKVTSPVEYVDRFVANLWEHRQNRMRLRMYSWCDELTRSGELFVVLFTNPADGMSYVRTIPAVKVDRIETDPEDLERELRYHELRNDNPIEGKWWESWESAGEDLETPVMLHYAVNRAVGCVRGQGDLVPILPWVRRYREWLEDRVRVNRYKNAFLWHVKLDGAGPGDVQSKQTQYQSPPSPGSVIVTDETEDWTPVQPRIQAEDVKDDGKALRLMIAAGAGIPLHYLAEGETATRSTAKEMVGPTMRHYEHRQMFFCDLLLDVVEKAAYRARVAGRMHRPHGGLQLQYAVSDLQEEDNLRTAQAASEIVAYLDMMQERGWITKRKAMELAYRFAGEVVDVELLLEELESESFDTAAAQPTQDAGKGKEGAKGGRDGGDQV
ncbi:MAG TPA: hypothetical protein ENO24_05425 [Chloroflexi bacterium]|nr:hypothetical protein [Chloroflexota bacterium]